MAMHACEGVTGKAPATRSSPRHPYLLRKGEAKDHSGGGMGESSGDSEWKRLQQPKMTKKGAVAPKKGRCEWRCVRKWHGRHQTRSRRQGAGCQGSPCCVIEIGVCN